MKPPDVLDEVQQRANREAHAARREMARDLMRTAWICIACALAGIVCIAWSAYTSDLFSARVAFYSGIAIGNGGVIFSVLAAYRRGERRGDW